MKYLSMLCMFGLLMAGCDAGTMTGISEETSDSETLTAASKKDTKWVPYHEKEIGEVTFMGFSELCDPGEKLYEGWAKGQATHVGQFTGELQQCSGADGFTGTLTMMAANGDKIFFAYEGENGEEPFTSVGTVWIDHGTGRFENVMTDPENPLDLFFRAEFVDGVHFPYTGTVTGMISSIGSSM